MAKVLDCSLVSKQTQTSSIPFQTNTFGETGNFSISSAMYKIVSMQFFYEDGLGIR